METTGPEAYFQVSPLRESYPGSHASTWNLDIGNQISRILATKGITGVSRNISISKKPQWRASNHSPTAADVSVPFARFHTGTERNKYSQKLYSLFDEVKAVYRAKHDTNSSSLITISYRLFGNEMVHERTLKKSLEPENCAADARKHLSWQDQRKQAPFSVNIYNRRFFPGLV